MPVPLPSPVPAHLGELHTYEQLLVWLIAFGPFVALAVVVLVVRRRDAAEARAEDRAEDLAAAEEDRAS
jgi:type VI protein secretion system component VasK